MRLRLNYRTLIYVVLHSLWSCAPTNFMGEQRYHQNSVSIEFTNDRYEYYLYEGSVVLKEYSFGTWSYVSDNRIFLKNNVKNINEIPMDFSVHASDRNFNIIFVNVQKGKFALEKDTTDYYNLDLYVNGKRHTKLRGEKNFITVNEKIENLFFKLSLSKAANGFDTPVDTLISNQITSAGESAHQNYYVNLDCEITQFFKVILPDDTIRIKSPKKIYWQDKGLKLIKR